MFPVSEPAPPAALFPAFEPAPPAALFPVLEPAPPAALFPVLEPTPPAELPPVLEFPPCSGFNTFAGAVVVSLAAVVASVGFCVGLVVCASVDGCVGASVGAAVVLIFTSGCVPLCGLLGAAVVVVSSSVVAASVEALVEAAGVVFVAVTDALVVCELPLSLL